LLKPHAHRIEPDSRQRRKERTPRSVMDDVFPSPTALRFPVLRRAATAV
jgi:hypothetical protein